MQLSAEDREALAECFQYGEPVSAEMITRLAGLDVRELLAANIVRRIGRWDTQLYKSDNFPTQTMKGTE